MSREPDDDNFNSNSNVFRECLSDAVLARATAAASAGTSIGNKNKRKGRKRRSHDTKSINLDTADEEGEEVRVDELADFIEYLADEIHPSLPAALQSLSYMTWQDDSSMAERYALPLSAHTVEEITTTLPPSINDTLEVYGLIDPPTSDLTTLLSPVLASYISTLTTPPAIPNWSSTRTSACEICDRDWVRLTYHHLIPRSTHAKCLKRNWHPPEMLNKVAWLCAACHSFVHRMAGNEELAREWYEVERILEREDVQVWRGWVGRVRWKKR